MNGAICGGVINETEFFKNPDAYLMCFVFPDEQYEKYIVLIKNKAKKEASKIFDKYAWSPV